MLEKGKQVIQGQENCYYTLKWKSMIILINGNAKTQYSNRKKLFPSNDHTIHKNQSQIDCKFECKW